jgi:hypothetical protein
MSPGNNRELWGDAGTYVSVPYDALPPVAGPLDGSFGWLAAAPGTTNGMRVRQEREEPVHMPDVIDARIAEAEGAGLSIPSAFATFMTDPELHTRVPSCTACYYDLGPRLIPIPNHSGPERLLRFLNDQQACYLWYLLLEPGGRHRIAFALPEWTDNAGAETLEDAVIARDVTVCAASFEEFIKRFWIENSIWFTVHKGQPLAGELRAYADAAKRVAAKAGARA